MIEQFLNLDAMKDLLISINDRLGSKQEVHFDLKPSPVQACRPTPSTS